MTPFQTIFVTNDTLFTNEVEVLVKFAHLNVSYATSNVNLAIIEQHTWVIIDAR